VSALAEYALAPAASVRSSTRRGAWLSGCRSHRRTGRGQKRLLDGWDQVLERTLGRGVVEQGARSTAASRWRDGLVGFRALGAEVVAAQLIGCQRPACWVVRSRGALDSDLGAERLGLLAGSGAECV